MTKKKKQPSARSPRTARDPLAGWAKYFPLVLAAAALAAYANSFAGPFIFDDTEAILDNPTIRSVWPLSRSLAGPAQTSTGGRPTVNFSLAVNYALGGVNPKGYHLFNIAVHVLAAMALYGVVRRTLLSERLRARWSRSASGVAMGASLLWLLHPIQTGSVTYVIQRAESMMGLFYLLTLYAFIRGAEAGASGARGAWFGASAAACLLGMATKESMATAPLAVLIYDRVFVAKSWREGTEKRWGAHAALWATLALLFGLIAGGPRSGSAGFGLDAISPLDYARAQFGVILHYLRLALLPHPLVLDYYWQPVRSWGPALPPAFVVLGLLGAAVWALIRRPAIGFAAFSFFLILAPSSTIVPIADLAFEHRMYLPLAPLMALAVAGGAAILRRAIPDDSNRLMAGAAIVAAISVVYAGLTLRRNHDYRSEQSVWEDVIAKRPENPRGYHNLGVVLHLQKRHDLAVPLFQKAIALRPGYGEANYNLGNAYAEMGQLDAAISEFRKAIEINPKSWKALNNLGATLVRRGAPQEGILHIQKSIELNPNFPDAHNNLGSILGGAGRLEEAIREFSIAIQLKPDYAEAQGNLMKARQIQAQSQAPR